MLSKLKTLARLALWALFYKILWVVVSAMEKLKIAPSDRSMQRFNAWHESLPDLDTELAELKRSLEN